MAEQAAPGDRHARKAKARTPASHHSAPKTAGGNRGTPTRRRPAGATVLAVQSEHVRGRPAAVFESLAITLAETNPRMPRLADERALLVVTRHPRGVRSEYRVVADDEGSHIDLVIVDVKGRARMSRGRARRVERIQSAFRSVARRIRIDVE